VAAGAGGGGAATRSGALAAEEGGGASGLATTDGEGEVGGVDEGEGGVGDAAMPGRGALPSARCTGAGRISAWPVLIV
jgi:hypothetical protein